MNILEVVKPPSIYHGISTWKMFWEEIFTPGNMKNCGWCNVKKDREIKNSEKYITLDISLKYGCLDKIKIKSLEPKEYLKISGKGLIASMGLNTIRGSKKNKQARYAITNVSLKNISKIIKEFEKFPYEIYTWNSYKHEPTDSYFI